MNEWKEGSKVFAFWEDDEYWYPATITKVSGSRIHVRYGDGREEVTDEDYLTEMVIEPGDEVECWVEAEQGYVPATVEEVSGERIQVMFEDERTEWATLDNLRYLSPDWEEGDQVFVFNETDTYWYPATIDYIDGDEYHVRYSDGREEVTDIESLAEVQFETGDDVECKRPDSNDYQTGIIQKIEDGRYLIAMGDGTMQWRELSDIRLENQEIEE